MKKLLLLTGFFVAGCVENSAAFGTRNYDQEAHVRAYFARKTTAETDFERGLVTLLERAEANAWDQNKTIDACIELARDHGVNGWKFKQVFLGVVIGLVISGGIGLIFTIMVLQGMGRIFRF